MRAEPGANKGVARAAALGLPLAALAAMLVQSLDSLDRERVMTAVVQAEADQAAGRSSDVLADQLTPSAPPSADMPPRAAIVRSVIRARAAARETDTGRRSRLIAAASDDADYAVRAVPGSGPAWLAAAFASYLRDGPASPRALHDFERSYVANAYLYPSIDWRLGYATAHWQALSATTRAAAAREAQWFIKLGASNRAHVYVLTGGTPLWQAISGSSAAPYLPRPRG